MTEEQDLLAALGVGSDERVREDGTDELTANVAATTWRLSADELGAIDRIAPVRRS